MLSHTSPKPTLNYSLNSLLNEALNSSIRNHLMSTSEVIYLMETYNPLKEIDLATTNLLFAQRTSLFLFPSSYKSLSFWTDPMRASLIDWMLPDS